MAGEEVKKSMGDLKKDFRALRSDLKGLSTTVRDELKKRLEGGKMSIKESAKKLEEQVEGQVGKARDAVCDQSERALEEARQQIVKRPLTMVLSAFAVGMVFGMLFARE